MLKKANMKKKKKSGFQFSSLLKIFKEIFKNIMVFFKLKRLYIAFVSILALLKPCLYTTRPYWYFWEKKNLNFLAYVFCVGCGSCIVYFLIKNKLIKKNRFEVFKSFFAVCMIIFVILLGHK